MTDQEYAAEQRRLHAAIPSDLQDLYRDAPRVDDRLQQVAWLARTIRPHALDHAVWCVFDEPRSDTEIVEVAVAITARLAWPEHIADSAVQRETVAARKRTMEALERIERRVRTLTYERAQASRMVDAVKTISTDAGLFVPTPLVLPLIKRIVEAAVRGHARRAG